MLDKSAAWLENLGTRPKSELSMKTRASPCNINGMTSSESTKGSNGVGRRRRRLVILTLLGFFGLTFTLSVLWKRLPAYSANPDSASVALPDSLIDGNGSPAQWSDLPPDLMSGLALASNNGRPHAAAGQNPQYTTSIHPAGTGSSAPSASPSSPATSTASPSIDSVLMLHWTPWCLQYSSGPFG
eukprot:Opistho-2@186